MWTRTLAVGASCAWLMAACDGTPADLREWKPSDHGNATKASGAQVAVGDAAPARAAPRPGLEDVTIVAWTRHCTNCHGRIGRGDGPQGPMTRATDLSNPEWQRARSNEQIANVIRRGKNGMPAFDLPSETVTGLVQLVRLFDRSRATGAPHDAGTPLDGATPPDGSTPEGGPQ